MTLPPLSLDRSAGALSRQLYDGLRDAILSGQFRVGTRMPSTRALAASLSVSRNTVHMAYEQLILEGLLEGKQGSGTFVGHQKPAIDRLERARMLNQICTDLLARAASYGFSLNEVLVALRDLEEDAQ